MTAPHVTPWLDEKGEWTLDGILRPARLVNLPGLPPEGLPMLVLETRGAVATARGILRDGRIGTVEPETAIEVSFDGHHATLRGGELVVDGSRPDVKLTRARDNR